LLRPGRGTTADFDDDDQPADNPVDADYLNKRLKGHLREAGLYDGESAYSLRRGGIQHRKLLGHTDAAIMVRELLLLCTLCAPATEPSVIRVCRGTLTLRSLQSSSGTPHR
jgi:hypothetical protein